MSDLDLLILEYSQKTDEAILALLAGLPVLPDEHDASWWSGEQAPVWDVVDQLFAVAEVAKTRQLRAAIPLIFERMSYGDPAETMRALKHPLEGIINPDWDVLGDICLQIVQTSPHKGARMWAVAELGRLREERAFPILLKALQEPHEYIVCEAVNSVRILALAYPSLRPNAIVALKDLTRTWQFGRGEWCNLQSLLADIEELQG